MGGAKPKNACAGKGKGQGRTALQWRGDNYGNFEFVVILRTTTVYCFGFSYLNKQRCHFKPGRGVLFDGASQTGRPAGIGPG